MHVFGKADARDLARGFGEEGRLLGSVRADERREQALAAAQVTAERHVFQNRHVRQELHMLEGAGDAQFRDALLADARDGLSGEGPCRSSATERR